MSIVARLVSTSATTSDELITLWHGTDYSSAQWIATKGIDFDRLMAVNPLADTFCTSWDPKTAWTYADINNVVQMNDGVRAIVGLLLPLFSLRPLVTNVPPLAYEVIEGQALEFYSGAATILNNAIISANVLTNKETIWTINPS